MDFSDRSKVQSCLEVLYKAENELDACFAWGLLKGDTSNLVGIVSLGDRKKTSVPLSIDKYTKGVNGCVCRYFESDNLYFLSDESLLEMHREGRSNFKVDYSISFDSNMVTHINTMLEGKPLRDLHDKFIRFVDGILYDDLNFDSIFYMVENVKNIDSKVLYSNKGKLDFWRSLDKNFRKNLMNYMLFSSIDCSEYKKTNNVVFKLTKKQCVREAVSFAYDFYMSNDNKNIALHYLFIQKIIFLHLLIIIRVQLSSKSSPKRKFDFFLEIMHQELGVYSDREAFLACYYFYNRDAVKELAKFHKGMKEEGLFEKIDNTAWDLSSPRLMELLIKVHMGRGSDVFIPFFATFDKKLRDIFSIFPAKAFVCDTVGDFQQNIFSQSMFDYFCSVESEEEFDKIVQKYFTDECIQERIDFRASKFSLNQCNIDVKIKDQYEKLIAANKV